MEEDNKYGSERQQFLLLRAEIVACMIQEVKLKISLMGYTSTEVATTYILRKFNLSEDDYRLVDTHSINIKPHSSLPNYKSIVYNDSGMKIVDIIF